MAEQPKHRTPRRRGLRIALFALAGLVLVGAGLGGIAYWKLNRNIHGVDISGQLGTARPPASTGGAFNVLVLGSDSRSGTNGSLAGGDTGDTARSDTAMVVHVNQAHTAASVVSIPRDTLVPRPACTGGDGKQVASARSAMFNSAYEVGGPACAVKTAEQLTGMRMDHFVEVDFTGFAALIDAIGGVDVTTTVPIDDEDSGLHLDAGTHHLGGQQALAFVRTRHGVGDGSDLGRIELQKEMVRAMLGQVGALGLGSNPVAMWQLGDKLTSSLTTDSDLASVSSLVGMAQTVKKIGPDQLTMVTLPVAYSVSDPNRVVPSNPAAQQLWAALRADRAVPPQVLRQQPANPAQADPSAPASAGAGASAGTSTGASAGTSAEASADALADAFEGAE
ncbi:LytR family transcriptional attenuator [Kitasatospora sp. SolWspMP-SS2h]|uniref:LCP family protein n=1 Tax=Kitasatospora sp. SolWspMP-SS2h TaxID=1305729 RepID=UPI000DBA5F9A|nr:LCP family protein [Kitasatospora sp. SolWspMP-SS2h]RAJ41427.1 LytR family transcriptional attenuator [Kitasatospora sp. SolWspMP-SS2h]